MVVTSNSSILAKSNQFTSTDNGQNDIPSGHILLLEVIVGLSVAVILLLLLILLTIVLILLARKRKTTQSLMDNKNINVITENPAYQLVATGIGEGAHNDLYTYIYENTNSEGIRIATQSNEINSSGEMFTAPNEAYPFCNEPHYEYITDVKTKEICGSGGTTAPNEAYILCDQPVYLDVDFGVVTKANGETSSSTMITAPNDDESGHTLDLHQYEDVNAVTKVIKKINSSKVITSPNEAYSVRDQPLDDTSLEYDCVHL